MQRNYKYFFLQYDHHTITICAIFPFCELSAWEIVRREQYFARFILAYKDLFLNFYLHQGGFKAENTNQWTNNCKQTKRFKNR